MPATGMRRPNILDVVQAVASVAPGHPEVAAWWYVPAMQARPAAGAPAAGTGERPVELVLEARDGASPDLSGIGAEVSERLWGTPVAVRAHRGAEEPGPLYRLLSRKG